MMGDDGRSRNAARILGIDPGLRETGWALVRRSGSLPPEQTGTVRVTDPYEPPDHARVDVVVRVLIDLADTHALTPQDVIGVEAYGHRRWLGRTIDTAPAMGRLVGALVTTFRARGHRVHEIPAAAAKTGWPRDAATLRRLLPPGPRNRHERDALLVAWATHLHDIAHHPPEREGTPPVWTGPLGQPRPPGSEAQATTRQHTTPPTGSRSPHERADIYIEAPPRPPRGNTPGARPKGDAP